MVEIGLIERAALAAIDRAGIAVTELSEGSGVEGDRFGLRPVEPHGDMRAVDRLDGAGGAVVDAGLLVGRGELDAVARRKFMAAVRGLEGVAGAELSPALSHGAQRRIEGRNIVVGVGEHEPRFVALRGAVLGPLLDQRGPGLALRAGPVDRALLLVDAERVVKIALGHHLGGAPVVELVLPFDLAERRGAMAVLERAEHAAAVDAR